MLELGQNGPESVRCAAHVTCVSVLAGDSQIQHLRNTRRVRKRPLAGTDHRTVSLEPGQVLQVVRPIPFLVQNTKTHRKITPPNSSGNFVLRITKCVTLLHFAVETIIQNIRQEMICNKINKTTAIKKGKYIIPFILHRRDVPLPSLSLEPVGR